MNWRNPRWNSLTGPDANELRAIFLSLQDYLDDPTFERGIHLGQSNGTDANFIYDAGKNVRTKPPLPIVGNDNLDVMLAGSTDWITNGMVQDFAIDDRNLAAGSVTTNALAVIMGGGNIVHNSAFLAADAGTPTLPNEWAFSAGSTGFTVGTDVGVQGKCLQITGTVDKHASQSFTLPVGKWAFGMKVKRTSVTPVFGVGSGMNIAFTGGTATFVKSWNGNLTTGGSLIETGTHDWRWEWVVFNVTATASVTVFLQQGFLGTTSGTTQFGEVQVEPGDVATAWAPKTDEILPGTVLAQHIAADQISGREIAATVLGVGKYIRSQGYVAGSAGWAIDAAGSAEFSDVTVRGTVDASTIQGSVFISSAVNSGKRVVIDGSSAVGTISLYSGAAGETDPANITVDDSGAAQFVRIESPEVAGDRSYFQAAVAGATIGANGDRIVVFPAEVGIFGAPLVLHGQELQGDLTGDAPRIRMRSGHHISFEWDGSLIRCYVNNSNVANI